MLYFFILTASASADDGRGITHSWHHSQRTKHPQSPQQYDDDDFYPGTTSAPSAELWDFLGIRVWQKQDDIFNASSEHDQEVKGIVQHHLNNLKHLTLHEPLEETTNTALLIIDTGQTDNIHIILKFFLSIGYFKDPRDRRQQKFRDKSTHIQAAAGPTLELKYTSVYPTASDETNYKQFLENILDPKKNRKNPNDLLGFRLIFLDEITNKSNLNNQHNETHFNLNWHHSEQGILQWLLNTEGLTFLDSIKGQPKYRIFILTYRDMCLRCSTTFFLAKSHLESILGAPVEIISMSIKGHTDKLHPAPQCLARLDQNQSRYPNTNCKYLIRGITTEDEQEERDTIDD